MALLGPFVGLGFVQATGFSGDLVIGPINLTQNSGTYTGALGLSNLPAGILLSPLNLSTNSGTYTGTIGTGSLPNLGGDATGTYSANTVGGMSASIININGLFGINVTGGTIQWTAGAISPTLTQAQSTAAGNGAAMTIQAQSSKAGSAGVGGTLSLRAGASDGAANNAGWTLVDGNNSTKITGNVAANNNITLTATTSIANATPLLTVTDSSARNVLSYNNTGNGASNMTIGSAVTSYVIKYADLTTNSGTAANLTVQAQNETGTTSIGGNLILNSGTGTTTHGSTMIEVGGNVIMTADVNGMHFNATSITIATSGNTTLSAAQQLNPLIAINTVTLTGAASITIPNAACRYEFIVANVTLGGFALTFKSGSATSSSISSLTTTSQVIEVVSIGGNTIWLNV